jgi:UDP-N-acetylglucosamine 2-epimerase
VSAPPLIAVAFGTRSEVVKLAPVVRALRASGIAHMLLSTGQHRALLDQATGFFGLTPDADLGVMTEDQPQPELLGRITAGMAALLRERRPTLLLVQGGTASAYASALAAFLERVPVGHVEAGLRSFDPCQPFPEETYRTLIADLSTWHFCPTNGARENLLKEGMEGKTLFVTGSTGVDAVRWAREQLAAKSYLGVPLPVTPLPARFVLVTCHRRESFGAGLAGLLAALREVSAACTDLQVIWPVHANPNVRQEVAQGLGGVPRVHLVDPVDYPTMLRLLQACAFVVTDSGGLQEEAPDFGKPLLLLRAVSDRPELLEAGGALLVSTDTRRIAVALRRLWEDPTYYARMVGIPNPFGDGQAATRIVRMLQRTHFQAP